MAKIISITNTKGGTGKSTVTMLLAAALALEDKKRILVLDCDSQTSIANLRKIEAGEEQSDSFDVEATAPKFVNDYLKLYSSKYDYIFLDLPRITSEGQSDSVYSLIARCDFILIPIIASHLDIDSTLAFLEGVKEIKDFKDKQKIAFGVHGFLNQKERNKNNALVMNIIKDNELEMFKSYLPRLRFFQTVSTIENPISFSEGKLRFKPFYNEFKKIIDND